MRGASCSAYSVTFTSFLSPLALSPLHLICFLFSFLILACVCACVFPLGTRVTFKTFLSFNCLQRPELLCQEGLQGFCPENLLKIQPEHWLTSGYPVPSTSFCFSSFNNGQMLLEANMHIGLRGHLLLTLTLRQGHWKRKVRKAGRGTQPGFFAHSQMGSCFWALPGPAVPLTHLAEGCSLNTSVFVQCLMSDVGRPQEPHFIVRKLKLGRVEVFSLVA